MITTAEQIQKEPVLQGGNERFSIIPINEQYRDLFELYEKHRNAFWSSQEIDFRADLDDWNKLSENEQEFIGYILAFFSGADGIVLENIVSNFSSEIKIPEARFFLGIQTAMENEHSLTYGLLIDTYIQDQHKRQKYFNAIDEILVVQKKAQWAMKYMDPKIPFSNRLVAFSVVEGVFFSGAFCAIFWLKDKNKMVKALGGSNELIARDEGLHVEFAVTLFHHLINKPKEEDVHQIIKDAIDIEIEFITQAIPCKMIGMNQDLMIKYVKFVSDRLLVKLGYSKLFNIKECPFDFMMKISMDGKTNFFEKRVSEYQLNRGKPKESDFNNEDFDF